MHPRTKMIDLLEEIRMDIKNAQSIDKLSSAQILAVLASAMEDHTGTAFNSLSQTTE